MQHFWTVAFMSPLVNIAAVPTKYEQGPADGVGSCALAFGASRQLLETLESAARTLVHVPIEESTAQYCCALDFLPPLVLSLGLLASPLLPDAAVAAAAGVPPPLPRPLPRPLPAASQQ